MHNFYFPTPFSIFVKNELTSIGTVFKVSVSQKFSQIQEEEEEETQNKLELNYAGIVSFQFLKNCFENLRLLKAEKLD